MPARLPAASRPMRLAPISRLGEIEKPSMPNRPLPPGAPETVQRTRKTRRFPRSLDDGKLVSFASPFGEANETSGISAV